MDNAHSKRCISLVTEEMQIKISVTSTRMATMQKTEDMCW